MTTAPIPTSEPMRLTAKDIPAANAVFARAFRDDPLYSYFFTDSKDRERMLPIIFKFRLRYGIACGEVYASSPHMEAVAIWMSSASDHMTFMRLIRTGGLSMFLSAGSDARKRMQGAIRWAGAIKAKHANFAHWHLSPIATDPPQQGKGYAGALIRTMLARLDAERIPCFLETQTERNVAIYEHYGFQIVEKAVFPGTAVNHWAMLRMPPGAG